MLVQQLGLALALCMLDVKLSSKLDVETRKLVGGANPVPALCAIKRVPARVLVVAKAAEDGVALAQVPLLGK